ncbi:polysaccharide biosynthesis C-terminal domain-containing protein [Pontivivens ytuae]|uniref:Polysaccharide biosynthesis C-terminal domain-containing protein n=1 Tax=Pontivivens ytuae TaxID=2789856 RepID=A0A7S9QDU4_9RHOB|nr:polysaccharide biosynthesis C-terminal domain-containing protein [Pontivivens ytuae]QPH54516.1 polysaccharide biosynthesis C-terminal domain-containing protein [Pontivivens ytuae]
MAASLVPYALLRLYHHLFNALDRRWAPLRVVLAGVAPNVPLNGVLIQGVGGLDSLDLAGAGIASLLATTFSPVLTIWLWRSTRIAGARVPA